MGIVALSIWLREYEFLGKAGGDCLQYNEESLLVARGGVLPCDERALAALVAYTNRQDAGAYSFWID